MAEQYYPFDAGAGSAIFEAEWTKLWSPLGVGVVNNEDSELSVAAGSPSMNVVVQSGKAWCRGHLYVNTSDRTLSIGTVVGSGTSRYDIIVVEWDFAANTATTKVVAGTAAATPSLPTLTQSFASGGVYQHPIAVVKASFGESAVTSAMLHVAQDRWHRMSDNHEPIGTTVDQPLDSAYVPDGWLLCAGQTVDALSYLKMRARMPAFVTGRYGYVSSNETIVVPDYRGRIGVGLDNMGGSDAARLNITNALGAGGGAQLVSLAANEMPIHGHGPGTLTTAAETQNHSHVQQGTFVSSVNGLHQHDPLPGTSGYVLFGGNNNAGLSFSSAGTITSATIGAGEHVHSVTIGGNTGNQNATHTHAVNGGASSDAGGNVAHENMPPYMTVNKMVKMF